MWRMIELGQRSRSVHLCLGTVKRLKARISVELKCRVAREDFLALI